MLSFHRCDNCPLQPEAHERCPAAVAMVPVSKRARRESFEKVVVRVEAPGRTYLKETSRTGGDQPLGRLVMATSGVPSSIDCAPWSRPICPS